MRRAAEFFALALLGCSNSGGASAVPEDASIPYDAATEDVAAPPVDAGPLWQPCQPANPASCPPGYECFPGHTAPVDTFHTCVFSCAGASGPLCSLSGGTCACPLAMNGGPGDCSEGNDAGAVTVCVPFEEGGPPGNNEIEDAAETVYDSATDAGAD
ncbi:MAG: hypothetical protein ACLQBL_25675 [Polyangiaceae bacterium]|jgi:hypothetical protein